MQHDTSRSVVKNPPRQLSAAVAIAAISLAGVSEGTSGSAGEGGTVAPVLLSQTGLFSEARTRRIAPGLVPFVPQYPLWTDGAIKRRWIALPPGTAVDASNPDEWRFPTGTRIWKEFSFKGHPVETRFMQRLADGSWLYAAYAWRDDGSEADLVALSGRRRAYPFGGGRYHAIPSTVDCKACHEGHPSRVLGFSALQLSGDRDRLAPHREDAGKSVADLASLSTAGLLAGLPEALERRPPRVPGNPVARAAMGYLHGNCGHCHNGSGGLANLGLSFWQPVTRATKDTAPAVQTTLGMRTRRLGAEDWLRIVPGDPDRSLVLHRVASRDPTWQMPPLGTALPDEHALSLLRAWIAQLSHPENRRTSP